MPMLPRRGFLASCAIATVGAVTKAFGWQGRAATEELGRHEFTLDFTCTCRRRNSTLLYWREWAEQRWRWSCPCGERISLPQPAKQEMELGLFTTTHRCLCPGCARPYEVILTGNRSTPTAFGLIVNVRELCDPCRARIPGFPGIQGGIDVAESARRNRPIKSRPGHPKLEWNYL